MKKEPDQLAAYLDDMKKRADAFEPKLVSSNSDWQRREAVSEILPDGATLNPYQSNRQATLFGGMIPEGSSGSSGGSGSSLFHMRRPYMPELDSVDRQDFPQDRRKANAYWRMFHKYDPLFGTAMDMYAEMLTSTFDIIIKEDSSKEIKDTFEYMCEEVAFIEKLRFIIREFLVLGEVFIHNFYDEDLKIWTHIGFHNPDYIEVKDLPMIAMDPILNVLPDPAMKQALSENTPESRELRQKLPNEFVSKVLAGQKIRLSPTNCSFLARKLHPYDTRGTSLATRLWRIWMVEDAVYNTTIAINRRLGSPINVLKMGDPTTGYLPSPSQETRMLEMLARAELDPAAWICTNYAVNFEAWGAGQQAISISRENPVIENIKLTALGLSKSFTSGEISYASSKSGLQVFLRRLLSMRQFLESTWIYPKFFKPISQMNNWKKAKPSEVSHRYRMKRTSQEIQEENLLIVPELVWHNKLDPSLDGDLLRALGQLKQQFGIKVKKETICSTAGLDWEEELAGHYKEFLKEEKIKTKVLGETKSSEYDEQEQQQGGAKPPGTPGGGAMPPGAKPPKGGGPTPPGGAAKNVPMDDSLASPSDGMPSTLE